MKKIQTNSCLIPNLYELDENPFLKKQIWQWTRFKDKQKFMPLLRGLSYLCKNTMSQLFVLSWSQQKKEKKISRWLHIVTQKQIMPLEQLYQLLSQNQNQKIFSEEVQKIKQFQLRLYNYVESVLQQNLLKFSKKKDYLNFNVYSQNNEFFIKAEFLHFDYELDFSPQGSQMTITAPEKFKITNLLVKQELYKKIQHLTQMAKSLTFTEDITTLYQQFYDKTYFLYDDFILKLQVFNNFPLLRLKNYVPIKFKDYKTGQALEGPIFSSANPECMYGHFIGYNAQTTKMVEGDYCESCNIFVDQLQENQLLMILRDNLFNPRKSDIVYCPQYNRFKLMAKVPVIVKEQQEEGQIVEEKVYYQTALTYLNYYHFKINLKKLSTKNRLSFNPTQKQQIFNLTFEWLDRKILILDPARGRNCQHYSFTDLRRYYKNFDISNRVYKCPIQGCPQEMTDGDIIYLKETSILMEYIKFKCEETPQLAIHAQAVIDHASQKLYIEYRVRENEKVVQKRQELNGFYSTLVDPYVPFAEYSLGIKEKHRKAKLDQYMFGGLRAEMEELALEENEEDEEDD